MGNAIFPRGNSSQYNKLVQEILSGDVLWENENIADGFEAQTIKYDTREYKRFEIVYIYDTESPVTPENYIHSNAIISEKNVRYVSVMHTSDVCNHSRELTVTDDGFIFENAYVTEAGQSKSKAMVPIKIIGYKY